MQALRNLFGSHNESEVMEITSKAQLQSALKMYQYIYTSETERDIIEATATFKNLIPVVDKYVSNDGLERKLVCLNGTIPVNYKENLYYIPICIWLSQQHPNLPPLVQVKPMRTMKIKVSNHVDSAGMVSIPYLNEWEVIKSDLASLIEVLCVVFGECSPVYMAASQKSIRDSSSKTQATSSSSGYPHSLDRGRQTSPQSLERGKQGYPQILDRGKQSSLQSLDSSQQSYPRSLDVGRQSSKRELMMDATVYVHSDGRHQEVKKKNTELLYETDQLLTAARILFGQTEEMICVLESLKSNLTDGGVAFSEEKLREMTKEKNATEHWLQQLQKDYKNVHAKSTSLDQASRESILQASRQSSLNERSSLLAAKSYSEWTNEDVCTWFEAVGMGEFVGAVREHRIRGIHLPNLAKDDLIELGIAKLGHRLTLEEEIDKLCNIAVNIM